MKTIQQKPSGSFARIATLAIATLGLGAASALAVPTVKLDIATQDFGNGNTIAATSATALSTSPSFTYSLTGTIDGTGALVGAVKPGMSIDSFIKGIVPNAKLTGIVPNPNAGGALSPKITLFSKIYTGTRDIPGFGTATISLKILAEILPTGKVSLSINNVSIKKNGAPVAGTIKFRAGSAVTVNTAAEIGFKNLNQTVAEDIGFVDLPIVRGKNGTSAVSVICTTASGTAVAGTDFTEVSATTTPSGLVKFGKNKTSGSIRINITPNTIPNAQRKFTVTLSKPTGGAVITPAKSTVTITILDND